jgi:hypothetical protein
VFFEGTAACFQRLKKRCVLQGWLKDAALSGDAFLYFSDLPIGLREMLEFSAAFRVPRSIDKQISHEPAPLFCCTVRKPSCVYAGKMPHRFDSAHSVFLRICHSVPSYRTYIAAAAQLGNRADMAEDAPTCPRCNQLMRLLRTVPSLGGLPALWVFHCAQCNEAQTQERKRAAGAQQAD